jgi:hypothetical protein
MAMMIASVIFGYALQIGADEKAIGVRPAGEGNFQVSFEPLKPVYAVGERIQFKVKANRTFYLYLFSIDPVQNRGYVILPNNLQAYNKYKADQEYLVPEKEVEFVSEQPGTEKITMLASTEKLNMKLEKYTKSGSFFSSEAGVMDEDIKALSIWGSDKKEQKIIKEISLIVVGQGQQAPAQTQQPVSAPTVQPAIQPPQGAVQPDNTRPVAAAFVSSDKVRYRSGDIMKITFGADRTGFVYLFAVEPDGRRSLLTKQPVSGNQFYQVKGKASLPSGEHALIAVYDEQGNLDVNSINLPEPGQKTKAIELIRETPASYAVYHLNVSE